LRVGWRLERLEEAHAGFPDNVLVELEELEELYELLDDYASCLNYVDKLVLDRDPRSGGWQFSAIHYGDGPGETFSCIWPLSLVSEEIEVEGFLRLMSGNADFALERAVLFGELAPAGELRWK